MTNAVNPFANATINQNPFASATPATEPVVQQVPAHAAQVPVANPATPEQALEQAVQQTAAPVPQPVQAPQPAPVAPAAPAPEVQQVQAQAVPAAPAQAQAAPVAPAPSPVVTGGEVSFDSNIKFNRLEKFGSMKQDEVTRIAFLLADANGRPRLRMTQVFNDKVNRRSYVAPENPALFKQMVERFGDARPRFGTVIAKYITDMAGRVLTADVQLLAFIFGSDKFNDLKMLDNQWGLTTRDLVVQCKESNFQKMAFTPCPEKMLQGIPGMEQAKIEEAEALFGKPLDMFLGKRYSDQEYMEILAGRVPGQAAPAMGAPGGAPAVNPFGAPTMAAPAMGAPGANPFGAPVAGAANPFTAAAAPAQANFSDLVVAGTTAAQ